MNVQRVLYGGLTAGMAMIAASAAWLAVQSFARGRTAAGVVLLLLLLYTALLAYACAGALRRGGAPDPRLVGWAVGLMAAGALVQIVWV